MRGTADNLARLPGGLPDAALSNVRANGTHVRHRAVVVVAVEEGATVAVVMVVVVVRHLPFLAKLKIIPVQFDDD